MTDEEKNEYILRVLEQAGVDKATQERVLKKVKEMSGIVERISTEIADMFIKMEFHKPGYEFASAFMSSFCTAILEDAYAKVAKEIDNEKIQEVVNQKPDLQGN